MSEKVLTVLFCDLREVDVVDRKKSSLPAKPTILMVLKWLFRVLSNQLFDSTYRILK